MSRFILIVSTFLFLVGSFTYSALAQFGDEGFPNTVFAILAEPPGANCPNGGSLIASGRDNNGNGSLGFNEVQQIGYACNGEQGAPGPAGPQGAEGIAGADGAQGPQGPAGAQGPAGPTGAAGPQGVAGTDGPQGPQGEVGPTGPKGDTGDTGAQGEQGVAGVDGAVGPKGDTGDTGPAGPQGEIGPAGADGTNGSVGVQGPPGADGIDGADGLPGVNGITPQFLDPIVLPEGGDPTICNSNPGTLVRVWTDLNSDGIIQSTAELETFEVCDGLEGPQGPQGVAGLDGADGPAGAIGPIGPSGPAGVAGTAGADGAQGPQGEQGPAGAIGPVGPSGPAGVAGADGADGAAGATGPQGEQGPQGVAGADGQDGADGAQGPEGPAGNGSFIAKKAGNIIGEICPNGVNGTIMVYGDDTNNDGMLNQNILGNPALPPSEVDGEFTVCDGQTGPQGIQGLNGTNGLPGATGPQGPAGADGADGDVPLENRVWRMSRAECPGNNDCRNVSACAGGEAMLTGACGFIFGEGGNARRVIYSGPNITNVTSTGFSTSLSSWQCHVENNGNSSRTYYRGVLCAQLQ